MTTFTGRYLSTLILLVLTVETVWQVFFGGGLVSGVTLCLGWIGYIAVNIALGEFGTEQKL